MELADISTQAAAALARWDADALDALSASAQQLAPAPQVLSLEMVRRAEAAQNVLAALLAATERGLRLLGPLHAEEGPWDR